MNGLAHVPNPIMLPLELISRNAISKDSLLGSVTLRSFGVLEVRPWPLSLLVFDVNSGGPAGFINTHKPTLIDSLVLPKPAALRVDTSVPSPALGLISSIAVSARLFGLVFSTMTSGSSVLEPAQGSMSSTLRRRLTITLRCRCTRLCGSRCGWNLWCTSAISGYSPSILRLCSSASAKMISNCRTAALTQRSSAAFILLLLPFDP